MLDIKKKNFMVNIRKKILQNAFDQKRGYSL
jgi:hypothetical protein